MKKRYVGGALLVAALTLGAAVPTSAQNVSPFAGYNVDLEQLLIGGSIGIPVPMGAASLSINPGVEYYPSVEFGSIMTFMVDMHVGIPVPNAPVTPYVGFGVAVNRASADLGTLGSITATNSQFNALGGLNFGNGPFKPFVEANARVIDGTALVLKGGGRIGFGK